VVRSADASRAATAATMVLFAGALGGCVETTQQKNARVQLQDERLLASRGTVKVSALNPQVTVVNAMLLRTRTGSAVAVTVRNDGPRPLSDLPINVGLRSPSGRLLYLNRQPELPYFQTHLAAIDARSLATWVFATRRSTPAWPAFARVGASTIATARGVKQLPAIASVVASTRPLGAGRVLVSAQVTNRSGISQSALEVYAYALAGERLIAAGAGSVENLAANAKQPVQIRMIGSPPAGAVRLETPPTNLQ
jgi:hypothetical protein